jgi:hypothetical protein
MYQHYSRKNGKVVHFKWNSIYITLTTLKEKYTILPRYMKIVHQIREQHKYTTMHPKYHIRVKLICFFF